MTDENDVEYIDAIYVTRLSDKEMCLIYEKDERYQTVDDLGDLEEQGIDTTQIETTSEYWYILFASEGADNAYYLALDQKQFSRQDAIDIAMTVKFN